MDFLIVYSFKSCPGKGSVQWFKFAERSGEATFLPAELDWDVCGECIPGWLGTRSRVWVWRLG